MLIFKNQIYPQLSYPSKPKTMIVMIIAKSYLVFIGNLIIQVLSNNYLILSTQLLSKVGSVYTSIV